MRWAQTANYGRVPNPSLPNAFLAQTHDLHDPWNVRIDCLRAKCCDDTPSARQLCAAALAGRSINRRRA